MIGLLSALLVQSALPSGHPPDMSAVAEGFASSKFSPRDLTLDGGVFNCSLTADDGRNFSLIIRDGGARGYLDSRNGQISTKAEDVSVVSTPAGLFDGYVFQAGGGADRGYNGSTKTAGAKFGESVDLELSPVTPPYDSSTQRFAIRVNAHWDWMPLTRGVGYCDLKRVPQQPLSESETRKYLKL